MHFLNFLLWLTMKVRIWMKCLNNLKIVELEKIINWLCISQKVHCNSKVYELKRLAFGKHKEFHATRRKLNFFTLSTSRWIIIFSLPWTVICIFLAPHKVAPISINGTPIVKINSKRIEQRNVRCHSWMLHASRLHVSANTAPLFFYPQGTHLLWCLVG